MAATLSRSRAHGLLYLTDALMFAFAIVLHLAEGQRAGWRAVDVIAVAHLTVGGVALAALGAFQHLFYASWQNGRAYIVRKCYCR
jgi:hypothetical protein